jgi:hypothetical protein
MVSFMLQLLHLQGKSPWYPLERVEICVKILWLIDPLLSSDSVNGPFLGSCSVNTFLLLAADS